MSLVDKVLEKVGLKYDDLNSLEREQLNTWQEALSKNQISVESVKNYISSMRDSVEEELCKTDNGTKQDIFLKARLRNYKLIEAFLTKPEKAQEALDRAVAGLVSNQK